MAGTGGSAATQVSCSFEISGSISPQIPTVGVVDWSTDLAGLTAARIEFSLDDPQPNEVNVGSSVPISVTEPSALLLGMKPARSYTYRIVATAGDKYCVSDDQKIQTQPAPAAPVMTQVAGDGFDARSNGFIVTCTSTNALIVDSDGAVVWWSDAALGCTRALMDWEGAYMWTMAGPAGPGDGGIVTRVSMDRGAVETLAGLGRVHHDFAVLPGGVSAFLSWTKDKTETSDLIERSADGTLRTLATVDAATLVTSKNSFHANALRYYARDDSYTVSDLDAVLITKFNRQGEVTWQAGSCENDASVCAVANVSGSHGHELLENGNLLLFSASEFTSPVYEYSFSQPNGFLVSTLAWTYQSQLFSEHFGDVQRLPNGNTLVTYSMYYPQDATAPQGTIQEISPLGSVVQTLASAADEGMLGYSTFRETLYGAPQ
jgi:hypothetical protein